MQKLKLVLPLSFSLLSVRLLSVSPSVDFGGRTHLRVCYTGGYGQYLSRFILGTHLFLVARERGELGACNRSVIILLTTDTTMSALTVCLNYANIQAERGMTIRREGGKKLIAQWSPKLDERFLFMLEQI